MTSPHPNFSARFRQEVSFRGCKLPELKSGLQKGIRRNNLQLALMCGLELWSFGTAPGRSMDKKRLRTNLLHRLMIIFLEDVGQEQYWTQVDEMYQAASAGEWPSQESIVQWITFLCRCPKSRACSHARAVAFFCDEPWVQAKYPKVYALGQECPPHPTLDQLIAVVRKSSWRAVIYASRVANQTGHIKTPMGRKPVWAVHHALQLSATELDLCRDQTRNYNNEATRLAKLGLKWGKELQNIREAFLCWMVPLLARLRGLPTPDPLPTISTTVPSELLVAATTGPIEFPAYVMDMHVTGRPDPERFALEGSVVTMEDATRVNPVWKQLYIDSKCQPRATSSKKVVVQGKRSKPETQAQSPEKEKRIDLERQELGGSRDFPNICASLPDKYLAAVNATRPTAYVKCWTETHAYDFIVRVQLTTSRNKTDVYVARKRATKSQPVYRAQRTLTPNMDYSGLLTIDHSPGELVIVKGPLKRITDAEQAAVLALWKRDNNVMTTDVRIEWLIPNRWPKGVPLGVRNSMSRTKPAPFLVATSLFCGPPSESNKSTLPYRIHSSKLWPATAVVATGSLPRWAPMKLRTSHQHQLDYVMALLYRYVFGLGDLADRNFVNTGPRLVSVDEDGVPKHVNFKAELKRNKLTQVHEWAKKYWNLMEPTLSSWKVGGPYKARLDHVLSNKSDIFT